MVVEVGQVDHGDRNYDNAEQFIKEARAAFKAQVFFCPSDAAGKVKIPFGFDDEGVANRDAEE